MQVDEEKARIDMATTVKAFREFHGKENEDVYAWIKGCQVIAKINQLSEDTVLKLMINNLRGKAQDWFANIMNESIQWTLIEFVTRVKDRFPTTELETKILNRFLNMKVVSTKQQFSELMEDATDICERNLININSLVKQFIMRCPNIMRPYLAQSLRTATSWQKFAKETEEIMWVCFPEDITRADLVQETPIINQVGRVNNGFRGQDIKKKKFCSLHGNGNHNTSECFSIKKLEKLGWKRSRIEGRVNGLESEEDDNKNSLIYSHNNPFYKKIYIKDKNPHTCLIDTGADVSIINKRNVPMNTEIHAEKQI
jgi:hypothetical protein